MLKKLKITLDLRYLKHLLLLCLKFAQFWGIYVLYSKSCIDGSVIMKPPSLSLCVLHPLNMANVANKEEVLQTIVAHYSRKLLLQTIVANYCLKLLLQTIVANYCCKLLLQTIVANYCLKLLTQTIVD